ncbi:MAG: DUF2384 domain-containing protein [Saccharospirillaceae bacterium]|nr:DUF2384 domain-containing protein [Saccharospirillaceae bacterium]MCD8530876.1 DUF2384 domain-containing protein [Saccharospirillaceae bacterium]
MAATDKTPGHIAQSDLLQNKDGMATAVKIASRIIQQWDASPEQFERILNLPSNTRQSIVEGEVAELLLTPDQLHRVAIITDMHASLRTLFMNPENVKGFMTMPNNNEPFAGRAPLDLIASGDIGELIRVQGHLAGMVLR